MNLTPHQLRELADAVEAANAGKPVEWYDSAVEKWRTEGALNPKVWSAEIARRPKPEPVTRDWTAKDVPPVCWLKLKTQLQDDFITKVLSVGETGIRAVNEDGDIVFVTYHQLSQRGALFSTDLREFKPCKVTEVDPEPAHKPHNPDNLTPGQVGVSEGYRLLNLDEIENIPDSAKKTSDVHKWDCERKQWDCSGWYGQLPNRTWRTKLTREELKKARGL